MKKNGIALIVLFLAGFAAPTPLSHAGSPAPTRRGASEFATTSAEVPPLGPPAVQVLPPVPSPLAAPVHPAPLPQAPAPAPVAHPAPLSAAPVVSAAAPGCGAGCDGGSCEACPRVRRHSWDRLCAWLTYKEAATCACKPKCGPYNPQPPLYAYFFCPAGCHEGWLPPPGCGKAPCATGCASGRCGAK